MTENSNVDSLVQTIRRVRNLLGFSATNYDLRSQLIVLHM